MLQYICYYPKQDLQKVKSCDEYFKFTLQEDDELGLFKD